MISTLTNATSNVKRSEYFGCSLSATTLTHTLKGHNYYKSTVRHIYSHTQSDKAFHFWYSGRNCGCIKVLLSFAILLFRIIAFRDPPLMEPTSVKST